MSNLSPKPSGRKRGFNALRDIHSAFWLIATVVISVFQVPLDAPRWLILHLLFLGAISHAILVWSAHFAAALLHSPPNAAQERTHNLRLALLNAGVGIVVVGVLNARWVITSVGSAVIAGAVLWHVCALLSRLRKAIGVRFAGTIHYYAAAGICLPVGAVLGTLLSRGYGDPAHAQVKLSHALLNILGWVGLTVMGTLVTLWPSMLRTRMVDSSVVISRRILPVFLAGIVVAAVGALNGNLAIVAGGLGLYFIAVLWLAVPFTQTAQTKAPKDFATLSAAAAYAWLAGSLGYLIWGVGQAAASGNDWGRAHEVFQDLAPFLSAGFVAQILIGALTYLVPVSISSGPASVKTISAAINRGGIWRVSTANLALLICTFNLPPTVRTLLQWLTLAALASFLIFMITAIRASHSAKKAATTQVPASGPQMLGAPSLDKPAEPKLWPGALAALLTVLATVVAGLSIDVANGYTPTGSNNAGNQVQPNGEVVTVQVEARDMRYFPSVIEVPVGTHLLVELTNTDVGEIHDLIFANGVGSSRLAPGASETIDVGIIGQDLDAWCSIIGHRQMGMTLQVKASNGENTDPDGGNHDGDHDHATPGTGGGHDHGDHSASGESAAADLDLMAHPGPDFTPHDAELPPLPARAADAGPVVHKHTFTVTEQSMEVAPGVRQELWTFNGTAPGPTLHGKVGDIFEITLVNNGSMGHSIDFHASHLAPDEPMRTIAPGESLVYRFEAKRAGIWMYHCSTMPMTAHIANGMFGAVIIEPDNLPEVDRSFVLVQSEFYLGAQDAPIDPARLATERPDVVAFNGYANQYHAHPLAVSVDERVRVWVLNVGPNRATSFHVVGSQFDRVWFEGDYLLGNAQAPADGRYGGSQALGLAAAQGGFVELQFPEAGHYPFVSHVMIDAERGAMGIFHATN